MDNKQIMKYIYAFSIGDGSLYKSNGNLNDNAMFNAAQLARNEDYINWRAEILSNITSVKQYRYFNTTGSEMIRTFSKTHPKYTTAYNEMYYRGRKTLTPHILSFLDWETLAIFFQDDGNGRCRPGINKTPEIRIASHNFNYAENWLFIKACKEKLDIQFNIQRQKVKSGDQYYISLRATSFPRFRENIEPYVKPSFAYKLCPHVQPLSQEGEDIV